MKYTVKFHGLYYATNGDTPGAELHPTNNKSERLTFTTARDARVWIAQRVASAMCKPGDWKVVRIRTKSKWISVSDRLPEPGDVVIVTDGGFIGTGVHDSATWCDDLRVTHWQPLPDPPK